MVIGASKPDGSPLNSGEQFAARLRGFGPTGITAFLVIFLGLIITPPIGAALVMLWLWLSRTPLH